MKNVLTPAANEATSQSWPFIYLVMCQHYRDRKVKHQWGGNDTKRCFCVDTKVTCQVKSNYHSPHFCCTLLDLSTLLWPFNWHMLTLHRQFFLKYMHCNQWPNLPNSNRMLTCFRAQIYHFAAGGKTSLPARKAAWAAVHWCELCW